MKFILINLQLSEIGGNWGITLIDWSNVFLKLKNRKTIALWMCVFKIILDFQCCIFVSNANLNLRWNCIHQPKTYHVITTNLSINCHWSFHQWRRKSDAAIDKTKLVLGNQSLLHWSCLSMIILTNQGLRYEHGSRTLAWWKNRGFEMSSTNVGSHIKEEEESETESIVEASKLSWKP